MKYIIHRTRGCLRCFIEDFQFAALPALQRYRIETIFMFINLSVEGLSHLGYHLLEHWLKRVINSFTYLPQILALLPRKSSGY